MADEDKHEDAEDFAPAINNPGYKPAGGQPKDYTMADKDKHEDPEDVAPTIDNPGHKPAGGKSVDEYQKLDAVDESLARWKASLGIGSAFAEEHSGPKLTVLSLELTSPTLPKDKTIKLDLTSEEKRNYYKYNAIQVKEGAPYKVTVSYKINHSIVIGARYVQVIKRSLLKSILTGIGDTETWEEILGSYIADPNPRSTEVISDDFPSGMVSRGEYKVVSKVVDDDEVVWLDWEWRLKVAKDW